MRVITELHHFLCEKCHNWWCVENPPDPNRTNWFCPFCGVSADYKVQEEKKC